MEPPVPRDAAAGNVPAPGTDVLGHIRPCSQPYPAALRNSGPVARAGAGKRWKLADFGRAADGRWVIERAALIGDNVAMRRVQEKVEEQQW